ncbi:hypothetical protein IEQ34_010875 [Dendrobium chrysotoxum]|uniref:Uncharacterized protein n=1 Tax=Dendrobium chrysotoxum TaxID=161865 RepID=A0AAV7GUR5_DENCH|nr:hypothetical protein IEQ34_010875 [Dendrobium chrysotoxum]
MALGEAEGEGATLFEGVVEGVRMVGPEQAVAGEGVVEGVVGGKRERRWRGRGWGGGEGKARGRRGWVEEEAVVEVEVDMAVEIIGVDGSGAEEFGDVEVGVRGESVL